MYYFDRIDVTEPNVCNKCHNLQMMSMKLSDIALSNIKSVDYRCIVRGNSKNEAINLIQNIDLTKITEHYWHP